MSSPPPIAIASVLLALGCAPALSQTQLPPGYWPEARSQEILQKTETLRLAPALDALTASERAALTDLLQVGTIVQQLYEDALHPQAATSLANLQALHEKLGRPRATQNLLDLFRLNRGPIATTLDNAREAFLPVAPQVPGRNRYPPDATREQIDAFLAAHPDRRDEILGERTVVRRAVRENLEADIKTLGYYSLLRELHPEWFRTMDDAAYWRWDVGPLATALAVSGAMLDSSIFSSRNITSKFFCSLNSIASAPLLIGVISYPRCSRKRI